MPRGPQCTCHSKSRYFHNICVTTNSINNGFSIVMFAEGAQWPVQAAWIWSHHVVCICLRTHHVWSEVFHEWNILKHSTPPNPSGSRIALSLQSLNQFLGTKWVHMADYMLLPWLLKRQGFVFQSLIQNVKTSPKCTTWLLTAVCGFCVPEKNQLDTRITGWWLTYPSEKYEFVSWDDEIPNIWEKWWKMFQTTNQIKRLRKQHLRKN